MFTVLDFDHWPRREIFTCFRRTAIYLTVQVDVTGLWRRCKRGGLRLYPALIYGAARVVNGDPAFRYGFDQQGRLGLWDRLTPYYTVPRREGGEELFSIAATEYVPDFSTFSDACLRDMEAAEGCGRLLYQDPLPENGFGISCVPGTSFSAFNFAGDVKEDLSPFLLYGGVYERDGRMLLPVGAEFAHAVNDGVHVSRFFQALEQELRALGEP